jgi:hypothetical protein
MAAALAETPRLNADSKLENLYVEMTCAFNEGTIKPARTRENTTLTRFEDFADEWANLYDAM